MELIDWPWVARNGLWVLGLSIAFAAWSYTSWWASSRRVRLRHALDRPLFQTPFSAGMTLFSASLAWGATRGWERILWIVLAAAFLWQTIICWRYGALHGWEAPLSHPKAVRPPTPDA